MTIPAFETSKGPHTLDSGVAKMLDIIALCQMTISLAGSDFYKDTGEGSKQMTVTFGGMSESKRKGAERQQTNRPHLKGIWLSFA